MLLIRLAWGVDYPYTKMPIEGIRNLDKMDIDFAREFGYRIKLLGRAGCATASSKRASSRRW